MTASGSDKTHKVLATNRKARHEYHILDSLETGIELKGTEVKSIRQSLISLAEAFADIQNGDVLLLNAHVQPYSHGNIHNHDPRRPRRLLLHRREIDRLIGQVQQKGFALVPLSVYLKRGKIKVELGVGKGKQQEDKRETLKRKTADREAERAMAAHRR